MIAPGKDTRVVAKLQTDNETDIFDGTAVSWIYTNNAGFPLQPVVTNYITNVTTITYTNPTAQRQTIPKGSVIGYLDIRSKDGSLIDLQWLIPYSKESDDYVFLGHTAFNSALADQQLATEENDKQASNRFEV